MGTGSDGRSRSGGTGSTREPRNGRQRGAGRADGGTAASGWAVAPELPRKRRRNRSVSPEVSAVLAECLNDGKPRAKSFPEPKDARNFAKRLRYAAAQIGARVQTRITPDGQDSRLTVTATREEPQ